VCHIRTLQRFWFRLLPLLIIVCLVTTGQAGTVVAESGDPLTAPGSALCGTKFGDVNGDGVRDSGELGLGGWTIQLLDAAGNVVATTITGTGNAASPAGRFCFNNVKDGSYTVREVAQAGWVQTFPIAPGTYSVTVGAGTAPNSLLFGNMLSPQPSTICGVKFEDKNGNGVQDSGELGLGGWTVQVRDEKGNLVATVVTEKGGKFCFERLRPGLYTFSEVMQPGWQQTLPGGTGDYTVQLTAEQTEYKPLLFGNMQAEGVICGIKFEDKNGNGRQDLDEVGLNGWTIQVKDAAGHLVATVVTSKDGTFCFKELRPGVYTFTEVMQPGYQQTFPGAPFTHTVKVVSGQTAESVNFGNQKQPDPCCLSFPFLQGRADNFATTDGPELAQPSPALVRAMPATVVYSGFDGTAVNTFFAHTFTLPLGNCVQSAKLEFKAKPLPDISINDTVSLRFSGVPSTPVWGSFLGQQPANPSLAPNTWVTSNYPTGQTFTLDLGSLPGGANLISTLNAQRFLDFVVQDDSSVDYVLLTVTFCECAGTTGSPDHSEPKQSVMPGVNIRLVVDSNKASVNREDFLLPAPAVIRNGSTLVPFRWIGAALGAEVQWEPTDRRATFLLGERKVELWIDKLMARVNGKEVSLSTAPTLIGGSTYVPVRFLSDAFGLSVKFNPDDQSIDIFDRWGNL
jgi:hypothetical protein